MKFQSKSLIILFSIVCYWFYLNVCFGFFLSKIFYNFFDEINKASLSKIIEFRKKFNFDNIKKSVFRYILKFFKDWIKRIGQKCLLLFEAINKVIKALKICRKKIKFANLWGYDNLLIHHINP